MELQPEYIDRFLPYGDSLRELIKDSTIRPTDVKKVLRKRGVYVADNDKSSYYHLAVTTLLSPIEFDDLKDRLQTREDNEKVFTRTIPWNSESEVKLINSIPNDFKLVDLIDLDREKYRITGNPNFIEVKGSKNEKIQLEYKVVRTDFTKSWYVTKSEHTGKIEFEKVQSGDKVDIQISYTAPETKDVANKVVKKIEKNFKEKGYVEPKAVIEKILFKNFTNEERIAFFWKLTGDAVSSPKISTV